MNPEAIPKWAPAGLVALVAAAALDVTGRIGQIGPARFTAYQLLALALTALVAWLLVTRRAVLPRTPLLWPLVAFLGTAAFSVVLATDRFAALVQLASLSSSVVLALIVAVLVRRPSHGARVVGGVLGLAAAFGVLAVIEWAGGFAMRHPVFFTPGYGIRARVTFDDPNILASFLMAALLLAIPLLVVGRMPRRWRVVGAGLTGIALVGLVTTYSRGGIGGLLVGLACVFVLLRLPKRLRLALVVIALLAVVFAATLVVDAGWVRDNVLELSDDGSWMNRVYMVAGAVEMWRDNPFGIGLDNYQLRYPEYRDPRAFEGIVESHTAYVTILAEMGFLGLLAFLWLLWRFFARTALPARRAEDSTLHALAVGAFAASAGLAAQAFTYSLEASKFWWFAIGFGLAAWRMYAEGESEVG